MFGWGLLFNPSQENEAFNFDCSHSFIGRKTPGTEGGETYRQLLISMSVQKQSPLPGEALNAWGLQHCVCAWCSWSPGAVAVSAGRSRREQKRHLGTCEILAKACSCLINFNLPVLLQPTAPLCTAPVKLGNDLPFGNEEQIKKVLSHPPSAIRAPERCWWMAEQRGGYVTAQERKERETECVRGHNFLTKWWRAHTWK